MRMFLWNLVHIQNPTFIPVQLSGDRFYHLNYMLGQVWPSTKRNPERRIRAVPEPSDQVKPHIDFLTFMKGLLGKESRWSSSDPSRPESLAVIMPLDEPELPRRTPTPSQHTPTPSPAEVLDFPILTDGDTGDEGAGRRREDSGFSELP